MKTCRPSRSLSLELSERFEPRPAHPRGLAR
jgi:hypothetical protein